MKTVLITCASSGFGEAAALAFARRGDKVYGTVRDAAKATALQEKAHAEGLELHTPLLDMTQAENFASMIQTIVDDSGIIIMISSLSGIAGLPGDVAYTTSKFALEGATEALRHEIDRWGIRVALVEAAQYATNISGSSANLPDYYPEDFPYQELIERKLASIQAGAAAALSPELVAQLLPKIADADGQQLRWPADELSQRILQTLHGQSDQERDAFLRGAGDSDWWSQGQ